MITSCLSSLLALALLSPYLLSPACNWMYRRVSTAAWPTLSLRQEVDLRVAAALKEAESTKICSPFP